VLDSLKRLSKHSAVYGLGHILARSMGFLLLPLYTNYLPAAEFGVAAVIFAFLALMTIVYTYGIDSAFLRYYILSQEQGERRAVFSTAFWTVAASSLVLSLLMLVAAQPVARLLISEGSFPVLVRLSAGILFFDALSALPFLLLRAEERSIRFASIKFLNVFVNVFFNILLIVYLKQGVKGIFLANLIASATTFLVLLPLIVRHLSVRLSRMTLRELLIFGLPYLPSTLAVVILELIDRFLLERMVGLEVTGLYNAGYKLAMFMALMVTAFRFAWHPFFLSTSKEPHAQEIFSKVLTYFLLGCSVVYLLISIFVDDLVRIQVFGYSFFGAEYWAGTRIVPVVMLGYILYGAYLNFLVGVYLEKKTHYLPFITGAAALTNVVGNLLLIPSFGMMGAAYATVAGYAVMTALLYFFSQRLYPVRYEFGRIFKIVLATALLFYIDRSFNPAWGVALKAGLVVAFPFVLLALGFFEQREVRTIKGWIRALSWQH
jgi:O-antigen/teichoic acid export membrane protein